MKNTQTKSQKIASCVIHAKEAHLTDQTDQRSPGTDVPTPGPTKQCTREGRWAEEVWGGRLNQGLGRTPPEAHPGAFWREASSDPPKVGGQCFHTRRWREPTSQAIKGVSTLTPHTPLEGLSLTLSCDLYSLG